MAVCRMNHLPGSSQLPGRSGRQWTPRLAHEIREFEAESVSYLVCSRLGVQTPSAAYRANYCEFNRKIPPISLDCAMKAAGLIENMGSSPLPQRKAKEA